MQGGALGGADDGAVASAQDEERAAHAGQGGQQVGDAAAVEIQHGAIDGQRPAPVGLLRDGVGGEGGVGRRRHVGLGRGEGGTKNHSST